MVELLNDFPPYVVAYRAIGAVSREEYDNVVVKRVNEVAAQYDAINFLVRLETDMQNYSSAALLEYIKISFKHIQRWNRMAIVTDQTSVRSFYDILSPLIPGKVKGFTLDEFEIAKYWVSEPILTDENWLAR